MSRSRCYCHYYVAFTQELPWPTWPEAFSFPHLTLPLWQPLQCLNLACSLAFWLPVSSLLAYPNLLDMAKKLEQQISASNCPWCVCRARASEFVSRVGGKVEVGEESAEMALKCCACTA